MRVPQGSRRKTSSGGACFFRNGRHRRSRAAVSIVEIGPNHGEDLKGTPEKRWTRPQRKAVGFPADRPRHRGAVGAAGEGPGTMRDARHPHCTANERGRPQRERFTAPTAHGRPRRKNAARLRKPLARRSSHITSGRTHRARKPQAPPLREVADGRVATGGRHQISLRTAPWRIPQAPPELPRHRFTQRLLQGLRRPHAFSRIPLRPRAAPHRVPRRKDSDHVQRNPLVAVPPPPHRRSLPPAFTNCKSSTSCQEQNSSTTHPPKASGSLQGTCNTTSALTSPNPRHPSRGITKDPGQPPQTCRVRSAAIPIRPLE